MCLTREEVQKWNVIINDINLVPLLQCCTWLCTSGTPNQLHILVISICTCVDAYTCKTKSQLHIQCESRVTNL